MADELVLPGCTFGLDSVMLNEGIIISIDGIQPDTGSATISRVRDVLTGRLLTAENVRSSDTLTMTDVLHPICAMDVLVVGAVSDSQESLHQAIAVLWPNIPHHVCQFHYLHEANRPMFDVDRRLRKQIRKALQQDVCSVRRQLAGYTTTLAPAKPDDQRTVAQCQMPDEYARAAQMALNRAALPPCPDARPRVDDALGAIATSLEGLPKAGRHLPASLPSLTCLPDARSGGATWIWCVGCMPMAWRLKTFSVMLRWRHLVSR